MAGKTFNVHDFVQKRRDAEKALARKAAEQAAYNAATAANLKSSLEFAFSEYVAGDIEVSSNGNKVTIKKQPSGSSLQIEVKDGDKYQVTETRASDTRGVQVGQILQGINDESLSTDKMQERVCIWAGVRLK